MTTTAPAESGSSAGALVFRGSAWQTLGRLLPQTYTVVTSIVAARVLGADGLGRLTFLIFVEFSLITILTANLPNATSRYVAEAVGGAATGDVTSLRRFALLVEVPAALVGAGTLLTIAALGASPRLAWTFAAIACASAVMQTVPSSVLIGLQEWRKATSVGLITGAVGLVVKVVGLEAGFGITGMLAVDSVTLTTNFVVTAILANRAIAALSTPGDATTPFRTRRSARYALLGSPAVLLTYVVWGRSEVFFLGHFSTDAQIAIYSLSFSGVFLLSFAPMAVGTAAGQAFARFFGAGSIDRIRGAYGRALRCILLLSVPVTAWAAALGPTALRVVYGSQYSRTGPVLLTMIGMFPLVSLSFVATAALVGLGRIRPQVIAAGAGCVLDVGLAAGLTPVWDAIGAAVANDAAQVVTSILLLVFVRRSLGAVDWGRGRFPQLLVVSAVSGSLVLLGVALLPGAAAVVVGLVVFPTVFFALASVLPVIGKADANWAAGLVGARASGVPGGLLRRISVV